MVDNSTIEVINSTTVEEDRRSRKIVWAEPLRPNGAILAYKVKVVAEDREQVSIHLFFPRLLSVDFYLKI